MSAAGYCLMSLTAVFATLCVVAGIGSLIAALSTLHWLQYEEDRLLMGAFKWCVQNEANGTVTCQMWGDVDGVDIVPLCFSLGFLFLALLTYFMSLLMMLWFTLSVIADSEPIWVYPSMWMTGVGANLTGVLVALKFIVESVWDEPVMGYSFHLAWAAILMVLLGLGLAVLLALFCSKKDGDDYDVTANNDTCKNEEGRNSPENSNPVREDVYSPNEENVQYKSMKYNSDTETTEPLT